MTENTMHIHRQMTVEEALSLFPDKAHKIAQELSNAGLQCAGCHAATWETLEVGMMGHGFSDDKIDRLITKLNAIINEKTDATTITMTSRATKKYLEILDSEGKHGWGIRFSDKMAGCNGFEYILDYSEKANEDDTIFVSNGIEIHVQNGSVKRLIGSEIDFVEGLNNSGFKITNPNVKSACGCGSSHGY